MPTINQAFVDSFRGPKLHGNPVMDLYPFVKLNLLAVVAVAAGVFGLYGLRLLAIGFYFVLAALAGRLKAFSRIFLPVAALLAFFIILARAAFQPGEQLIWSWWIINVTVEGTLYGVSFALLVIEICGAIMLFYNITPMKDLMYAVERLGATHSASYIALASMQEVVNLGKSANIIMQSQSARGVETQGKLMNRVKAFFPILGPLFLSAISNTEEKNIAMDTRAFSAPEKPTHIYELRRPTRGQWALCILLNAALVAAIVWRIAA